MLNQKSICIYYVICHVSFELLTGLKFSCEICLLFEVLAAWFRLKYPHIAIGALAASAPILEFGNLTPWDGFYRIISENALGAIRSMLQYVGASRRV